MATLVIAEHNQKEVSGGTLSTVTAANKIDADVTLLVLGSQAESIAKTATKIAGIKEVLLAKDAKYDHLIAEEVTELLLATQKEKKFSHILAPSSNASKNYLPRLGAKLDSAPISDIIQVTDKDTFYRPTYAGNAIAQIKSKDEVKLITVRPTGFEKAATEGGSATVNAAPEATTTTACKTEFVSEEVSKSERPDLASARVVISGGRGLKSGDNFEMLYKLADKLGGAVGASRAAVDAGFVPNELQVGQTGKVVAPELYIAVGISGAIQHLAGMKDSKTIVAINKDEEAPIFQVSDYGLVADLFTAVPELTEKI
jgi:electron transfer flavoprotein alpha subunit